MVDEAAQIVVQAQAHGTGTEQELLVPLVEASAPVRAGTTALTADAGYHSEANLAHLAQANIDAWLPDSNRGQTTFFRGILGAGGVWKVRWPRKPVDPESSNLLLL